MSFLFVLSEIPYFNPRSHEGSDREEWKNIKPIWDFNPRSHEGSDWCPPDISVLFLVISIHAPTRGATFLYLQSQERLPISIHAPTRGATVAFRVIIYSL